MTAETYPRIEIAEPLGERDDLRSVLAELTPDSECVRRSASERHTTHLWLRLSNGDEPLELFVKIYRPPLKRNLTTLLLASRARREYRNSRAAADRGLAVLPAVAYGERRRRGVVVDQLVAFRDLRHSRSLARLLLKSRQPESDRRYWLPRFADELGRLHEGGYLHLQASPRNLLICPREEGSPCFWIDHPSGVLFRGSIRARLAALADILQALNSRLLFPDEEHRQEFLRHYAPGDQRFADLVGKLRGKRGRTVRASFLRRSIKVMTFHKAF